MESSPYAMPTYQKPQKVNYYSTSLNNECKSPLEMNGNRFLKSSSLCPLATIQILNCTLIFSLTTASSCASRARAVPTAMTAIPFLVLILQNNAAKRNVSLTDWLTIFL